MYFKYATDIYQVFKIISSNVAKGDLCRTTMLENVFKLAILEMNCLNPYVKLNDNILDL